MKRRKKATSKWFKLPEEMHNTIIQLLDNRAKRSLRATCKENYALVNQFRCMNYKGKYGCSLREGRKDFILEQSGSFNGVQYLNSKLLFPTAEAMISCLHDSLKNIDSVQNFYLDVDDFSEPIPLLKKQLKLKAEKLMLNLYGNCTAIISDLPNLFDTNSIGHVLLAGENIGEEFFRAFKVDRLGMNRVNDFNDAQLLNLNVRSTIIVGARNLTVPAVKDYFKKMLKQNHTSRFSWRELNRELLNVFDYGTRYIEAHIFISPRYSNFTLHLLIILDGRQAPHLKGATMARNQFFLNRPLSLSPALRRFIRSIELDL